VKTASGGPALLQSSSCSATDLVSEESARPSAPAAFHAVPANLNLGSDRANAQNQPGRRAGNRTGGKIMMVVGMLSLEECYRNVRRYAVGVMPMARRNARVKFDSEENWQASAISDSDARPVAIIALALSSRRPLT
jgi:hypothetical protein